MAITLDIELRRMDLTDDEHSFRELIKDGNVEELRNFLKVNETICSSTLYDKTLQQAMANNNKDIVALLSEMKYYQASTMTLKLAAILGYHREFNGMLKNRSEINHDNEISTLLIAALESENLESVQKLQELRQSKALGKLDDEVDRPNNKFIEAKLTKKQLLYARETSVSHNSLRNAHNRINLYKIIANPLYIILYEIDPINAAVQTSNELISLANRFPANKNEFIKISQSCKQLAVELLDCCEDDEEVADLLNSGRSDEEICICHRGRLWNMMRGELIEFVTHPCCQYWLYSRWCGEILPIWENYSYTKMGFHILKHSLLFPIYSIRNAIVPPPIEKRVPMNYFIHSLTAYCYFLMILLYIVFYDKTNTVTSLFSTPDYAVGVWVVTSIMHTVCSLYTVPYPSFWKSWWTTYDIFLLFLFLIAGISNLIATTHVVTIIPISYFLLTAEGVYAIAITISFMKILHWFHTSSRLGPVIISFSRMTNVILKLLIIFIIVLFSFSFGMYRLFRYFRVSNYANLSNNTTNENEEVVFNSYVSTLKVLFWVIFGYGEPTNIEIPSSYGLNNVENESVLQMKQNFIMVIGYVMWAIFHVAFVIVLLNMLIAIMTTSYETITKNSDANWKFARTRLWMYYMEENNTVPPPFNVFYYAGKIIRYFCKKCRRQSDDAKHQNVDNVIAYKKAKQKYQDTLSILIDRYESKRFENSVLRDQYHSERISYVEARKRILHNRLFDETTPL